jgi:hypothetical protein
MKPGIVLCLKIIQPTSYWKIYEQEYIQIFIVNEYGTLEGMGLLPPIF